MPPFFRAWRRRGILGFGDKFSPIILANPPLPPSPLGYGCGGLGSEPPKGPGGEEAEDPEGTSVQGARDGRLPHPWDAASRVRPLTPKVLGSGRPPLSCDSRDYIWLWWGLGGQVRAGAARWAKVAWDGRCLASILTVLPTGLHRLGPCLGANSTPPPAWAGIPAHGFFSLQDLPPISSVGPKHGARTRSLASSEDDPPLFYLG